MISENTDDQTNIISCCYKEPKWSGICTDQKYGLDILKNGVIIDNIKLSGRSFHIVGRYKTCDLMFEHPSLSRFHSVLQYCDGNNDENKEKGWYVMDLDSTHGTIVNKKKIPSHTFIRIHTGHVIKFGGSTRLYIVTGPEDDKEQLSRYTWTELMEMKSSGKERVADSSGYLPSDNSKDNSVCLWGMSDNVEEDESFNRSTSSGKYKHEDLYKEDPKKIIKGFFEREGFDEVPQYEFNKLGFNNSKCSLELPVFGENGEKIIAEVSGSDKKKDMIFRCALEACRILDEMDELFKTGGTVRKQKKDNKYYQDKDYYSSDEDDYFDRTGQIEEKRIQRMRRFGVISCDEKVQIPDIKIDAKSSDSSLVKFNRLEEINEQILTIEEQLEESKKALDAGENCTELDEIEKYLEAIQSGAINKKTRLKLRAQLFELTKEENLLRKQLKLSIPVTTSMRKSLYECKDRAEKNQSIVNVREPNNSKPKESNERNFIEKNKPPFIAKVENSNDDEIENDSDEGDQLKNGDQEDVNVIVEGEKISSTKRKNDNGEEIVNNLDVIEIKRNKLTSKEENDLETEISDWVPPIGQTGDGKTSLNEKFGY